MYDVWDSEKICKDLGVMFFGECEKKHPGEDLETEQSNMPQNLNS
jgi:hypothetical protein